MSLAPEVFTPERLFHGVLFISIFIAVIIGIIVLRADSTSHAVHHIGFDPMVTDQRNRNRPGQRDEKPFGQLCRFLHLTAFLTFLQSIEMVCKRCAAGQPDHRAARPVVIHGVPIGIDRAALLGSDWSACGFPEHLRGRSLMWLVTEVQDSEQFTKSRIVGYGKRRGIGGDCVEVFHGSVLPAGRILGSGSSVSCCCFHTRNTDSRWTPFRREKGIKKKPNA